MGLSPYEVANVFSNLGAATASTPVQAQNAAMIQDSTQGGLRAEYEEKKRQAEKKAKKSKLIHTIGKVVSTFIPGPLDDIAIDAIASEIADDEGSFGQHLMNAAIPAVASYGIGEALGAVSSKIGHVPGGQGPASPGSLRDRVASNLANPAFQSELTGIASSFIPQQGGASSPKLPMGINSSALSSIRADENQSAQLEQRVNESKLQHQIAKAELDLSKLRIGQGDQQIALQERGATAEEGRLKIAQEDFDWGKNPENPANQANVAQTARYAAETKTIPEVASAQVAADNARTATAITEQGLAKFNLDNAETPQQTRDAELANRNADYKNQQASKTPSVSNVIQVSKKGEDGELIYGNNIIREDGTSQVEWYDVGITPSASPAERSANSAIISGFGSMYRSGNVMQQDRAVAMYMEAPEETKALIQSVFPDIDKRSKELEGATDDYVNGGSNPNAKPGTPGNPIKIKVDANGVPVINR